MSNESTRKNALHVSIYFILSLLLSACGSASIQPKTFDFGAKTTTLNQNSSTSANKQLQIKLADIRVPNSLDGDAMLYRLLYSHAQELLPFSLSRWTMPPAQLLTQRLKNHFNQLGIMVINANDGINHVPVLRIELEEFSQHFSSANQSQAVIQFRASLISEGTLLAQRSFQAGANSATPDAQGGAQAMPLASDITLTQLSLWLTENSPKNTP
jgi:cholesterol transport system auxiliary component